METSFTVKVYSPRWGHDDTYHFILNDDELQISGIQKYATCKVNVDDDDVSWNGYNDITGNPLVKVLENDSIYPPSVFVSAIEEVWCAWRDGRLNNAQVREEITLLFDWLNMASHNKPSSDFWIGVF